jgi:hypothetical protein
VFLSYGSYTHEEFECTVAIDSRSVPNDAGQPYLTQTTWTITGQIIAADAAGVVAKMAALEAAYSAWFRDAALTTAAGVVCHHLPNAGSYSGVRVVQPPSFPRGEGAQLSTFRDYAITLSADYPIAGQNPLKAFQETLSFSGGGPQRAVLELLNGPPQEQVLKLFTAFRAVQAGSAVGAFGWPAVPPPLFPGKEEVRSVPPGNPQRGSPKLVNGLYADFPVSWTYQFASGTPLVGSPNVWPAG